MADDAFRPSAPRIPGRPLASKPMISPAPDQANPMIAPPSTYSPIGLAPNQPSTPLPASPSRYGPIGLAPNTPATPLPAPTAPPREVIYPKGRALGQWSNPALPDDLAPQARPYYAPVDTSKQEAQMERDRLAQQKAEQDQRNYQVTREAKRTGRETIDSPTGDKEYLYTDAEEAERKRLAAEKVAADKQAAAARDAQRIAYKRQGRDTITLEDGSIAPVQSDEEWSAAQAEEGKKKRQAAREKRFADELATAREVYDIEAMDRPVLADTERETWDRQRRESFDNALYDLAQDKALDKATRARLAGLLDRSAETGQPIEPGDLDPALTAVVEQRKPDLWTAHQEARNKLAADDENRAWQADQKKRIEIAELKAVNFPEWKRRYGGVKEEPDAVAATPGQPDQSPAREDLSDVEQLRAANRAFAREARSFTENTRSIEERTAAIEAQNTALRKEGFDVNDWQEIPMADGAVKIYHKSLIPELGALETDRSAWNAGLDKDHKKLATRNEQLQAANEAQTAREREADQFQEIEDNAAFEDWHHSLAANPLTAHVAKQARRDREEIGARYDDILSDETLSDDQKAVAIEAIKTEEEARRAQVQESIAASSKGAEALWKAAQATVSLRIDQATSDTQNGTKSNKELANAEARARIEQISQTYGLNPGEAAKQVLDYETMLEPWQESNDEVRVLPVSGQVIVNPSLAWSADKYAEAVNRIDATPEAKQAALAEQARVKQQTAPLIAAGLRKLGGFRKFEERNVGTYKTETELIDAYFESRSKAGEIFDATKLILETGGSQIVSEAYGNLGWWMQRVGTEASKAKGDEIVADLGSDTGSFNQATQERGAALKGLGVPQFVSDLGSGAVSTVPSLLAGAGGSVAGTKVLGLLAKVNQSSRLGKINRVMLGPIRSMPKTIIGAGIGRFNARQAGKLAQQAGLYGAGGGAYMQSFGSVYPQAYAKYLAQGMPEEEAEAAATGSAMGAGAATAGLTIAFGRTGVEKLIPGGNVEESTMRALAQAVKTAAQKKQLRQAFRSKEFQTLIDRAGWSAIKETSGEAVEEGLDQFAQGLMSMGTYESDKTLGQVGEESLYAALIGGVLGGAFGGVASTKKAIAESVAARGQATQPESGTESTSEVPLVTAPRQTTGTAIPPEAPPAPASQQDTATPVANAEKAEPVVTPIETPERRVISDAEINNYSDPIAWGEESTPEGDGRVRRRLYALRNVARGRIDAVLNSDLALIGVERDRQGGYTQAKLEKGKAPDVYIERGKPIIAEEVVDRIRQALPNTGKFISFTEAEARESLRQAAQQQAQPVTTESVPATADPTPSPRKYSPEERQRIKELAQWAQTKGLDQKVAVKAARDHVSEKGITDPDYAIQAIQDFWPSLSKAKSTTTTADTAPETPASPSTENKKVQRALNRQQKLVNTLTGKGVVIHSVKTLEDAERIMGRQKRGPRDRGGFATRINGKPAIFLIEDRLSNPEAAERALLHEAVHAAHYLLRAQDSSLDDAAIEEILDNPAITKAMEALYPGYRDLSPSAKIAEVIVKISEGKLVLDKSAKTLADHIKRLLKFLVDIRLVDSTPALAKLAADVQANMESAPKETETPVSTSPEAATSQTARTPDRVGTPPPVPSILKGKGPWTVANLVTSAMQSASQWRGRFAALGPVKFRTVSLTEGASLPYALAADLENNTILVNPVLLGDWFKDRPNAAAEIHKMVEEEYWHLATVAALIKTEGSIDGARQKMADVWESFSQAYPVEARSLANTYGADIIDQSPEAGGWEVARMVMQIRHGYGQTSEQVAGNGGGVYDATLQRLFADKDFSLTQALRDLFQSIVDFVKGTKDPSRELRDLADMAAAMLGQPAAPEAVVKPKAARKTKPKSFANLDLPETPVLNYLREHPIRSRNYYQAARLRMFNRKKNGKPLTEEDLKVKKAMGDYDDFPKVTDYPTSLQPYIASIFSNAGESITTVASQAHEYGDIINDYTVAALGQKVHQELLYIQKYHAKIPVNIPRWQRRELEIQQEANSGAIGHLWYQILTNYVYEDFQRHAREVYTDQRRRTGKTGSGKKVNRLLPRFSYDLQVGDVITVDGERLEVSSKTSTGGVRLTNGYEPSRFYEDMLVIPEDVRIYVSQHVDSDGVPREVVVTDMDEDALGGHESLTPPVLATASAANPNAKRQGQLETKFANQAITQPELRELEALRDAAGQLSLFDGLDSPAPETADERINRENRERIITAANRRLVAADYVPQGEMFEGQLELFSGNPNRRDAEYLQAVESGDMESAQQMVDEEARAAGYEGPYYHGGVRKLKFTDPAGTAMEAIYVTDDEHTAYTYADRYGQDVANIQVLYVRPGKQLDLTRDVEAFEKWTGKTPEVMSNGDITSRSPFSAVHAKAIREAGYDSVKINDTDQMGRGGGVSTLLFKPESIKLGVDLAGNVGKAYYDYEVQSGVVTYDKSGNVIPLSQRFNPASDSILYASNPNQRSFDFGTSGDFGDQNQMGFNFGDATPATKKYLDKIGPESLELSQPNVSVPEKIEQIDLFFRNLGGGASIIRPARDYDGLASPIKITGAALQNVVAETPQVNFLGERIKDPEDLALKAQALRNPGFETFYLIAVDSKKKVVDAMAITARAPHFAHIHTSDRGFDDWADFLKASQVKSFYMVHNHPSGDPSPSEADRQVTQLATREMQQRGYKMLAHVVINHYKYQVISSAPTRYGEWSTTTSGTIDIEGSGSVIDPFSRPERLGLSSISGLVNEVRQLHDERTSLDAITIIFLDSKKRIAATGSLLPDDLRKIVTLDGIREYASMHGATDLAVAVSSEKVAKHVRGVALGEAAIDIIIVKSRGLDYESYWESGRKNQGELISRTKSLYGTRVQSPAASNPNQRFFDFGTSGVLSDNPNQLGFDFSTPPRQSPTTPTTNDLSSSQPLERDRPDPDTRDTGRPDRVPSGRGTDRPDGGSLDDSGTGRGLTSQGSLMPDDLFAALGGDYGNREIRSDEPGDQASAPGSDDTRRSGEPDADGLSPEPYRDDAPAVSLAGPEIAGPVAGSGSTSPTLASIRRTAPALTPDQAGDVAFLEKRFAEHPGALLTNGTGTGKTFSGLGWVARELERGAQHILIVAPSDKVCSDWVRTAKEFFQINDVAQLTGVSDNGVGNRVVVTTYANLGQNSSLVERPWTGVVTDEAHYLSQSKQGDGTRALESLRALTAHRSGTAKYAAMKRPEAAKTVAELTKIDYTQRTDQQRAALDQARAALRIVEDARKEELAAMARKDRPKALLLSATPFAHHFSLDYGEGYLYDYPPENKATAGSYRHIPPRSQFYIENLGYRIRNGKLTSPENATAVGIMERRMAERLMREGAMAGRRLDVDQDYGREFVLTETKLGERIDEILSTIRKTPGLENLGQHIGLGTYLERRYLFEGLKARESVERIRKHLAMGRQVVVFHDYKKGGAVNPLPLSIPGEVTSWENGQVVTNRHDDALARLKSLVPHYEETRRELGNLISPIDLLQREFGEQVGVFNGSVPKAARRKISDQFNDAKSGMGIILVQRASGKEGISLHDTKGDRQRVIIDLGFPARPTDAIQCEGRIYRMGVKSPAIFEYLTTGTDTERWTFAQTIAQRASTAENLAMGEQARALLQAFADGYNNAESLDPRPGQGFGGKEGDAARHNANPFTDAVALYYANQKRTSRNKSAEGKDYFATPEPLGYKMVEWADIRPGDKVLEPSAGHGAIARFFPDATNRHAVEPSFELLGRLALNATDLQIHQSTFEDYDIHNKFNVIVMNPPFGTAGKTAMDHVAKATRHLRDGGRVVALIPEGPSMDKRFDAWMDSAEAEGIYLVASYGIPAGAFERAGTGVKTRVVILDKSKDPDAVTSDYRQREFAGESVEDFFAAIKDSTAPLRPEGAVQTFEETEAEDAQTPATPSATPSAPSKPFPTSHSADNPATFSGAEGWHAKKNVPTYVATIKTRLDRPEYDRALAMAKKHGGYYSAFKGAGAVPGFQFPSPEARDGFLGEALGGPVMPAGANPNRGDGLTTEVGRGKAANISSDSSASGENIAPGSQADTISLGKQPVTESHQFTSPKAVALWSLARAHRIPVLSEPVNVAANLAYFKSLGSIGPEVSRIQSQLWFLDNPSRHSSETEVFHEAEGRENIYSILLQSFPGASIKEVIGKSWINDLAALFPEPINFYDPNLVRHSNTPIGRTVPNRIREEFPELVERATERIKIAAIDQITKGTLDSIGLLKFSNPQSSDSEAGLDEYGGAVAFAGLTDAASTVNSWLNLSEETQGINSESNGDDIFGDIFSSNNLSAPDQSGAISPAASNPNRPDTQPLLEVIDGMPPQPRAFLRNLLDGQTIDDAAEASGYGADRGDGIAESVGRRLRAKLAQQGVDDEEGRAMVEAAIMPAGANPNQPRMVEPGFYSQLAETIEQKIPSSATPQQILATIDPARGSGVKEDEIKWSGLRPALERMAAENGGKVPKAALLEYLANDGAVRFEEVVMSDPQKSGAVYDWAVSDGEENTYFRSYQEAAEFADQQGIRITEDTVFQATNRRRETSDPRYAQYQLPGGENYREIVLAMPEPEKVLAFGRIEKSESGRWRLYLAGNTIHTQSFATRGEAEEALEKTRGEVIKSPESYASSHFPTVPNYVAHMRVNERTDSTGAPGLFIEELQSDRHQAGRKNGYQEPFEEWMAYYETPDGTEVPVAYGKSSDDAANNVESGWKDLVTVKTRKSRDGVTGGTPDAPFRKDWSLQLFKRALRDAVATGKDWIGWTVGETQNERFDLSKQVKSVWAEKIRYGAYKGDYEVRMVDVNGKEHNAGIREEKDLPDVLGKELAQKIVAESDNYPDGNSYTGLDLKIEGTGMKGFYDDILPKEIGKYVKQWGATVEQSEMLPNNETEIGKWEVVDSSGTRVYGPTSESQAISWDNHRDSDDTTVQEITAFKSTPIHRVTITPQMRASVQAGQKLFAANPNTPALRPTRTPGETLFDAAANRVRSQIMSSPTVEGLKKTLAEGYAHPLAAPLRKAVDILLKEATPLERLPTEVRALMNEMRIKQAFAKERAMDVVRSLSGKAKFSDLAWPAEFARDPGMRVRLYNAMAGLTPMRNLPPAIQEFGKQLRERLKKAGLEAVRQGRMHPDTYLELVEDYMPHYYYDHEQAGKSKLGGIWQRMKLAMGDVTAQQSTMYRIKDMETKDRRTGENGALVTWDERGKRVRFRDAQHRNGFYEGFILERTADTMNRARKDLNITPAQLARPLGLEPELRGYARRVEEEMRKRYQKGDPLTEAQQDVAGLIRDPVYAVARYISQMEHDNATAAFFNGIADSEELLGGPNTQDFIQLPENPKLGKLGGKFVAREVAEQIVDLIEVPSEALQIYDALLTAWKTGKTVYNPGTHVRNVLGNLIFAKFAGVDPRKTPEAWKVITKGGPKLEEMFAEGVLGSDFLTSELRNEILSLLPMGETVQDADFWSRIGMTLDRAWQKSGGAMIKEKVESAYRIEDEIFKATAYLSATEKGMTPSEAAAHVRKWFPYYDHIGSSTTIRALKRTGMPFFSFEREAIRILANAARERPITLAAAMALPMVLSGFSAMILGLDDEEYEEIRDTAMRGKGKFFGKDQPLFSILLPLRNTQGRLQQWDMTNVVPFAGLLGQELEIDNGLPPWQKWALQLIAGSPVTGLALETATNTDTFRNQPIWEENMTPAEKRGAYGAHVAAKLLPPLLPGGTSFRTLTQIGERTTNKSLEKRDAPQAIGRAIAGLDVRNASPDIYALADRWREENGIPREESSTRFPSTPEGRSRANLFAELVQDEPDIDALAQELAYLKSRGNPIETDQDLQRLLFYRNPVMIIKGKENQDKFVRWLSPEGRTVYQDAQQEFRRIQRTSPIILRQARARAMSLARN